MAGLLDWLLRPQMPQPNAAGQPGTAPGLMVDPVTGQTYSAAEVMKAQNAVAPEMANGLPQHRAAIAAGLPVNGSEHNKAAGAMPAGSVPQPSQGDAPGAASFAEPQRGGLLNRMGDALIGLGNPYADPSSLSDPHQRQMAIGQALLTLGSGIGNSRSRNPLGSLGEGVQYAQAQGQQTGAMGLQRALSAAQLENLKATTEEKRQKTNSQRAMASMFGVPMGGGPSPGGASPGMPASVPGYGGASGAMPSGGVSPSMPGTGDVTPSNFLSMVPPEFRPMAQAYAAAGDYDKAFSLIQKGMGGGDDTVRYNPQSGRYEINPLALQAKSAIAAAGRPNVTTKVEIAAETEGAKQAAKDAAEAYKEMQAAARNSVFKEAALKRLDALLDQVETGKFSGSMNEVKAIAKNLGVDLASMGIRDDVAPAQAAAALSNVLTMEMRNPAGGAGMPGAMSDADRSFLAKTIPSIETTREGRKLMVEWYSRLNAYNRGLGKAVQDYVASRKGVPDYMVHQVAADYAAKNPIFNDADIAAAQRAAQSATVPRQPQGGASALPRARGPSGEIIELDPATNQWKRVQ